MPLSRVILGDCMSGCMCSQGLPVLQDVIELFLAKSRCTKFKYQECRSKNENCKTQLVTSSFVDT